MHEVILQFYTHEEVTPRLFAEKIILACAYRSAIKVGERVSDGFHLYEYQGDHEVEFPVGKVKSTIVVPKIELIHP